MMKDSETQKKRVILSGLSKLMFSVLILGMLWIGFSFVGTNEGLNRVVVSKVVDLASYQEGGVDIIEWEGRPVLVLRRSNEMIEVLRAGNDSMLRDPHSTDSKQPKWAESEWRSRDPEWFVAIANGTDFGCPVAYLPESDETFSGEVWRGGFKDTCRGSRYDLSGRVYQSQSAESNLEVPSYRIEKGVLHLGGV